MCNVLILALFIAIGGIITGYHNSSMSGILEMRGFQENFPSLFSQEFTANYSTQTCSVESEENTLMVGLFVALSSLGCAIGSLFAGKLADIISRRNTLALSGLVMMLGSVLIASSYYDCVWMMFVGRIMNGICIGILYVLMPMYIGEMSPKTKRGLLISMIGPGFAIGVLIGLFANVGFSRFSEGWRVAGIVLAMVSLVYSIGFIWLPHTPSWLVMKNRTLEALAVLSLFNDSSKEGCFVDTIMNLEDLVEAKKSSNSIMLFQYFKRTYLSRLFLMLLLFLMGSQVFTLVGYYSVTFFCLVGISQPILLSIILGPIAILASVTSVLLIDRIGRKITLIGSSCVNFIVCFAVGSLLLAFGSENPVINYTVVILTCLNTFFLFLSWTVIPWIISSEIFPLKVKGVASSLSNSTYWMFSFIFNTTFPPLVKLLDLHGYMYITGTTYILAILIIWIFIPETKGVSLEHVDELFHQTWRERLTCGFFQRKKKLPTSAVISAYNPTAEVRFSNIH